MTEYNKKRIVMIPFENLGLRTRINLGAKSGEDSESEGWRGRGERGKGSARRGGRSQAVPWPWQGAFRGASAAAG